MSFKSLLIFMKMIDLFFYVCNNYKGIIIANKWHFLM